NAARSLHRSDSPRGSLRDQVSRRLETCLRTRSQALRSARGCWRQGGTRPRRWASGAGAPSAASLLLVRRAQCFPPRETLAGLVACLRVRSRALGVAGVGQVQPSNWGTLLVSFRPESPNHLVRRRWAVPSWYMAVMARLTASQPLRSPFLRPTPYFSSVNGALIMRPGRPAAKPARIRSSVED